jgi:hypothetical protein
VTRLERQRIEERLSIIFQLIEFFGEEERMMEAGIWVIAMCLVIITILTVLDYFDERDDDDE